MAENFILRPALEQDALAIKNLIHEVRINPMDLNWEHFIVAETSEGQFAGCGQLKLHGDGSVELASIAVKTQYRNQGLASQIIRTLMAAGPRPLYLTCRSNLGPFYEKFGFRVLTPEAMSPYFRRISKFAGLIGPLVGNDNKPLVMRLDDSL